MNLVRFRSSRFLVPGLALAAGIATAAPAPAADCIRFYAGCLVKASDLGSSSAQSVILMFIVIVLTVVQFRYVEKKVQY